jgi:1-acyl-sn-glycerol-3-phosphate acyltransferase
VPQTYYDCKRLFSWDFFKGGLGTFRVRQYQFIDTKGLEFEDTEIVKEKIFQIIYNELLSDSLYMKDTNSAK